MGNRARDAAFAQFVGDHRRGLLGAAYLMFSSPERAEHVLQAELARLYASWPPPRDPRQLVLRELMTSTPARLVLPWQRSDRFELLDRRLDPPPPSGIVAELADLDDDARRAVILVGFVGLSLAETAAVLRRDESEVLALVIETRAKLAEGHPVRESADRLSEQLRAAVRDVPVEHDLSVSADLAHGQLLVRRRRLRTGLVVAAALLAVMVGIIQVTSAPTPRADQAADGPATSAPPVITPPPTPSAKPTCDTRQATCRDTVLRDWRSQMALLTRSYVDPGHDYFAGYTYSRTRLYESAELWRKGDSVVGLDMSRLVPGATEIYLQVATSRKSAVPCGKLTHNTCLPQRFLDGNTYTLTQTTDVSQGIEVQYSPLGDEVITVVARNTSRGHSLDVTRADLMSLVADPRLRLPPH